LVRLSSLELFLRRLKKCIDERSSHDPWLQGATGLATPGGAWDQYKHTLGVLVRVDGRYLRSSLVTAFARWDNCLLARSATASSRLRDQPMDRRIDCLSVPSRACGFQPSIYHGRLGLSRSFEGRKCNASSSLVQGPIARASANTRSTSPVLRHDQAPAPTKPTR
jgi:hypothetical protein